MIKVEKFHMAHLKNFTPREVIGDFETTMIENVMDPHKDIVAIINGGETICIAGINHLRLGVCEAWLIPSDSVNRYKLSFFKAVRRLVDFVFQNMSIHRFEIAIDCEWHEGTKWAKALGFKFESIAREYDFNRRDHAIYTRIE